MSISIKKIASRFSTSAGQVEGNDLAALFRDDVGYLLGMLEERGAEIATGAQETRAACAVDFIPEFSTTMKEGDIFTLDSRFKRRTFWDWLTRKPRQLQPLVVTRVCAPYAEYETANAGSEHGRPKP